MGWIKGFLKRRRITAGKVVAGVALVASLAGSIYYFANKTDLDPILAKEPVIVMVRQQTPQMMGLISEAESALQDKNTPLDRLNEIADSMVNIAKAVSKPLSHRKEIDKAITDKYITQKEVNEVEFLKSQIVALANELATRRQQLETKVINDEENAALREKFKDFKPSNPP